MLIITFYMIEMGNIFLLLEDYFLAKFSIEIILDKTLIWTTWKTTYSLLVKNLAVGWDTPHIGGSKRGRQGRAPPPGPNSFIFMQFLTKIINKHTQFGSWRPLEKILDPPLRAHPPTSPIYCLIYKNFFWDGVIGQIIKSAP